MGFTADEWLADYDDGSTEARLGQVIAPICFDTQASHWEVEYDCLDRTPSTDDVILMMVLPENILVVNGGMRWDTHTATVNASLGHALNPEAFIASQSVDTPGTTDFTWELTLGMRCATGLVKRPVLLTLDTDDDILGNIIVYFEYYYVEWSGYSDDFWTTEPQA